MIRSDASERAQVERWDLFSCTALQPIWLGQVARRAAAAAHAAAAATGDTLAAPPDRRSIKCRSGAHVARGGRGGRSAATPAPEPVVGSSPPPTRDLIRPIICLAFGGARTCAATRLASRPATPLGAQRMRPNAAAAPAECRPNRCRFLYRERERAAVCARAAALADSLPVGGGGGAIVAPARRVCK